MPRGDRTGPAGMGPKSGRGAGFCAGYGMPGFANAAPGQGSWINRFAGSAFGMGNRWFFGFCRGGRGQRHRFFTKGFFGAQRPMGAFGPATAATTQWSREDEIRTLKSDLQGCEQTAAQIRTRLEELEKSA